jgi:hypothetical protein
VRDAGGFTAGDVTGCAVIATSPGSNDAGEGREGMMWG